MMKSGLWRTKNFFNKESCYGKKNNQKKFAEEDLVSFDLNALAGLMSMFANDLLFLHHHAVGDKFDTIHALTTPTTKVVGFCTNQTIV